MKYKNCLPAEILFLLFFCISISSVHAQLFNDSLQRKQAIESLTALYINELKENIHLYNGSEYLYTGHNVKGFPFFESAEMLKGAVYYDGNLYPNVNMQYDLINDELIIQDYTNNYPVQLIKDKIEYFIIDSSKFINAGIQKNLPFSAEGFYQQLYSGNIMAFARKWKQQDVKTSSEGSDASYKEYNRYFVYTGNKVYEVSNEKSVLNIFKNRKAELKKFIAANNLSYKENFEEALVKTMQHIDQSKK